MNFCAYCGEPLEPHRGKGFPAQMHPRCQAEAAKVRALARQLLATMLQAMAVPPRRRARRR